MSDHNTKSKVKKNALFNSLSFIFISGVNFLTLPFIVNKMGIEVFGIYTLLTGLFGYFGIFDFGLGQGLIKFVSEYHAKNQLEKLSLAINSCLIFQVLIALILIISLYCFSPSIIRVFNVSNQNFAESETAFKVSLLGLFISLISAIFSSVLMGLQRYDLTSTVDSITNFLLNISLVGILIFAEVSLLEAVLISVLFTFLSLVVYVYLIVKKVPYYHPRIEFNVLIVKSFTKYSINIFLSKLSGLFSNHFVRIILSYYLSPSAVTLFVVPSKLLNAIGGMLSSGANSLFPYISSLHVSKDMDVIKQSFLKATAIFAGISIPVLLFITLYSKQVLTIWMGADFADQTWLILSIITFSGLVASSSTIPNLVILGLGNSRLIALFSIGSIVLYLIFLPLLTANYGLVGCAFALLIASSATIFFVVKYNLRFIDINPWQYLKVTYGKHVYPSLFIIATTLFIKLLFSIENSYLFSIGVLFATSYYYFIYKRVYLKINN